MINKLERNRKIEFFLLKIYHLFFSERFNKKINFNFDQTKNRLNLIQECISRNNYTSYLEIGCDQNQIFDNIQVKSKIGVDPVSGGNFKGTSDFFFSQNKKSFDCVFIDGLHHYDQVLKDIKNSLKFLNTGGIIILHDTLPDHVSKQYIPRCRYSWNGDVWKSIVEVRTWENCDTITSLIDQGVSLIKKQKNQDILNLGSVNFKKLKFSFFYENFQKIMRTKSYLETLKFI